MRVVGVAVLWVVIIGGISLYMDFQGDRTAPVTPADVHRSDADAFSIDVTLTFNPRRDPFALDDPDGPGDTGLTVRMNGRTIPIQADEMTPGVPLRVGPLTAEAKTVSELYIETGPPMDQPGRHDAARVRVLRDDRILAEKTIWATSGQTITGTLQFSLTPPEAKDGHER